MNFLMTLALEALALSAAGAPAPAGEKAQCESSRPPFGDTMEVRCSLSESDVPRKFRFQVRFTGGHDDTMASMSVTLDGRPVVCEPGSKTELMGEFGDVGLECRFSTEGRTGARELLNVAVRWSHAQYADFQLGVP